MSRLGGHGCGWVTGARHVPAEVVGEVGGRVGAERHGAGGGLEGAEVEAAVDVEDLAGGVIEQAVGDGADEIDMVINRGAFLAGELALVQDEISAVREACGKATLKVILETSELETYDNIRLASFLAMRVLRDGDFIKTSTGKTNANATLANNQVMLDAIRDHYFQTGVEIAMKPAGGIRTAKQAITFLVAVKETLGDRWLNNTRYRFGASSLLNDLILQLEKERTGRYQAPYALSEASGSY